jgi:hypothetical protein
MSSASNWHYLFILDVDQVLRFDVEIWRGNISMRVRIPKYFSFTNFVYSVQQARFQYFLLQVARYFKYSFVSWRNLYRTHSTSFIQYRIITGYKLRHFERRAFARKLLRLNVYRRATRLNDETLKYFKSSR